MRLHVQFWIKKIPRSRTTVGGDMMSDSALMYISADEIFLRKKHHFGFLCVQLMARSQMSLKLQVQQWSHGRWTASCSCCPACRQQIVANMVLLEHVGDSLLCVVNEWPRSKHRSLQCAYPQFIDVMSLFRLQQLVSDQRSRRWTSWALHQLRTSKCCWSMSNAADMSNSLRAPSVRRHLGLSL